MLEFIGGTTYWCIVYGVLSAFAQTTTEPQYWLKTVFFTIALGRYLLFTREKDGNIRAFLCTHLAGMATGMVAGYLVIPGPPGLAR